jgi:hypothetical protein
MALTNVSLADVAESHLQRLIAAQAAESLHVEYKRETYGTNDDQRRELLADVSSFANAAGGSSKRSPSRCSSSLRVLRRQGAAKHKRR